MVAVLIIGFLIANKYFNIFAAGSDITNTATIYYTEGGVEKSAQSNTVTTTVTANANITANLTLQGRTDYTTTGTIFRVYPVGETTPVFEKLDVATDSSGNATIAPTGLTEGTNYDFKIKTSLYLASAVLNKTYNNGTTVSFGALRGGALNNDNIINTSDYQILLTNWFTANVAADINTDGIVNTGDFAWMSQNWLKQDQ